jgi:protein gp37
MTHTAIEWATHTFNPWIGCTKVSPGCANCYAEMSTPTRVARKNGRELWGRGKTRQRTSAVYWKQPAKWNLDHQELIDDPDTKHFMERGILTVERHRVFPSLCDWLDDEVPIEWLAEFLKLIHDTPNLDWLLLTKRPENWKLRLLEARAIAANSCLGEDKSARPLRDWLGNWIEGEPPANVQIGASVEDQTRADERIPALLKIPAKVRFLSVEPLLGPVSLTKTGHDYEHTDCLRGIHRQFNSDGQCREFKTLKVDWVIIGGESGPGARPCNVEWIRDIVRHCKAAGVAAFNKQLGSNPVGGRGWLAGSKLRSARHNPKNPSRNFEVALRHPKGGDPSEWPEDLRVRQFPNMGGRTSP